MEQLSGKQQPCTGSIWTGPWLYRLAQMLTGMQGSWQYAGPISSPTPWQISLPPYLLSQSGSLSKTVITTHSKNPQPDTKARLLKGQPQPKAWLGSRWAIPSKNGMSSLHTSTFLQLLRFFNSKMMGEPTISSFISNIQPFRMPLQHYFLMPL